MERTQCIERDLDKPLFQKNLYFTVKITLYISVLLNKRFITSINIFQAGTMYRALDEDNVLSTTS